MFQQRLLLLLSMLALFVYAGCSGETPKPADAPPAVADEGPTGVDPNLAPPLSATVPDATVPDEGTTAPIDNGEEKSQVETIVDPTSTTVTAKVEKEVPKRDALPGRWFLVLNQAGSNFNVLLLDIAQEGDGLQVTAVAEHPQLSGLALKSSEFEKASVHITLELGDNAFDFRGTFADGEVLGNMLIGGRTVEPTHMAATAAKSFEGHIQPQPTPGRQEFIEALQTGNLDELPKLVAKFPSSPLVLASYPMILGRAKAEKRTAEDVQQQISALRSAAGRWGPRITDMSILQAARALTLSRYLPDVALQIVDEVAAAKSLPEEFQTELESVRGFTLLLVDDPDQQQQGAEIVRELRKQNPFNAMVTYSLAEYAQRNKRADEAMTLFAELAVLPNLENFLEQQMGPDPERALPSETAALLWKEKHGSTDGYDKFLDQVYSKSITAFAAKPGKPATGNRIVLCELFTGAMCPPCVAADVATAGLEKTYPKSEVIVLRYHEHIPGPDQLTNPDSETRFRYYNGRATPTVCVNGEQAQGMGGYLPQSKDVYGILRDVIEPLRETETAIVLKLSAAAKDGQLNISADVTGLETPEENLRLRLVIVEDEIPFAARNGIRMHEMVVRSMPGGPEGIAPSEGALKHAESINLAEFKQQLADYINGIERDIARERPGFQFDAKPLDFHKLHLVAFVQNDDTQEILQVAAVPVTGELVFPGTTEPAEAEEKKDE